MGRPITIRCRSSLLPACFSGLILVLLIAGCNSTQVVKANSQPAIKSDRILEADEILEIGIVPLDPNIPQTEEAQREALITPEVRRAEGLYLAYHLKDTLEKTGNWGAVRVVPAPAATVDITVTGTLYTSDGEILEAELGATDSTGRVWLEKSYKDNASKFTYELPEEDPFQDFYNRFANDLLAVRDKLKKSELREIKTVSGISYARDLSPDAFAGYIEEKSGRKTVRQLPAVDDPMIARIQRIKDKDYLFVDTLDEFYGKFYKDMKAPYHDWREYTYEEAINLRRIQEQARNKLLTGAALIAGGLYAGSRSENWAEHAAAMGAVTGGIGAVMSGMSRQQEAEIHAQSLKEISESLASEISPLVFEVEGHQVELKGTIEGQYEQWRQILREIYAEETGLPVNSQAP